MKSHVVGGGGGSQGGRVGSGDVLVVIPHLHIHAFPNIYGLLGLFSIVLPSLYNNTGRGLTKIVFGGGASPRYLARPEVMHYPDATGG
jgi:hypothetical protein